MFYKIDIIRVGCTISKMLPIYQNSYGEKLSSLSYTKLDGIIEVDEFYIKSGLKGRSYHNEIVKSVRQPRKRGLKP